MKFENLFYHDTSVGVGSQNPTRAIPCLKFSKWGRAQQKLGLILYPKKDFWVVRFPCFRQFPHFPLTLKARGNFHFPPFPLSLKAHGNFYFPHPPAPRPPNSESTWKHAFFPHFPPTLKAHGNMLSSPISPQRWKHMETCFFWRSYIRLC
jgi:hypothetical protein